MITHEIATKWISKINSGSVNKWCYDDMNGEECFIEANGDRLEWSEMIEFGLVESFLILHKYILYSGDNEYFITDFGKYYLQQTPEKQKYLISKNLLDDAIRDEHNALSEYVKSKSKRSGAAQDEHTAFLKSGYRGYVRTFNNEDDIINDKEYK